MKLLIRILIVIAAGTGAFFLVHMGLDQAVQWATIVAVFVALAAWLFPVKESAREPDKNKAKQIVNGVITGGKIRQSASGGKGHESRQTVRGAIAKKNIVQEIHNE